MSDPTYIYRRTDGNPSGLQNTRHIMRVARKRLKRGQGPFSLSVNGKETGPLLRRKALSTLRDGLRSGHVGDHFRVHNRSGQQVFSAKGGQPAVTVIDTTGNDKIDKVWSYEKAKYPGVTFLGAYVCKDIVGTTTHSQHSYGNAVDCGGVSMGMLDTIAKDLARHYKSLSLENVIVADRIWTRGQGWRTYTGEFHYHCHADCAPGINPALPCGVRG